MSKPFFSIVIPTKNRPVLLRDAIQSVLRQDFDDLELIVSDNFNDWQTKGVVDEFSGDDRLRYIRTSYEMNIPDHWEFAAKGAGGDYVLLLTDRAFLRQGSLKDIYEAITTNNNPLVVFWNYGYFNERNGGLLGEKENAGRKILKSAEVLKNYCLKFDAHYLPRPHVGCYRRDLIEKIRKNFGRLYWPFSPDFTSSLLVLAYSDEIMYLPRPLLFFQGAELSAGTKAQTSILRYLDSLGEADPYKYIPIKAPINGSLIFNDFLKIKALAKRNFEGLELDWVFCFSFIYQELWEKRLIWGMNRKSLETFWQEWARALAASDEQTRVAVKKSLKRQWIKIFKSYVRETYLGRFLLKIKRAFLGKPTYFYQNAMAAGGFTNY